jgi:DNA-directed RNA polymerase specialized sigma24 family protein
MFGWLHCWRLKRRQHALALAWCGDPLKAAWLVRETRVSSPRVRKLDVYKRMADCWLRSLDNTGAPPPDTRPATALPGDPLSAGVRDLIARMPMAQRMTLSLVDIARLSYRETASVMDIGLFDVQYHIVTARRQLLQQLHASRETCTCPVDGETVESC